jgi:hypothetical protein
MTSAWTNYKLGFKLLQVEKLRDVQLWNSVDGGFVGTRGKKVQERSRGARQVKASF